jgi:uncharacterized protein (DUF1697 family)
METHGDAMPQRSLFSNPRAEVAVHEQSANSALTTCPVRPMTSTYAALLRGINVGGKNRILMADLVACFRCAGYGNVRSYIQSGNVVFRSTVGERAERTESIEEMLADAFGYEARVELRSRMSRLVSHPVYQRITIRNWNTPRKLYSMMDDG